MADDADEFGDHGVGGGDADGVAEAVGEWGGGGEGDSFLGGELGEAGLDGGEFGGAVAEEGVEIFESAGVAADGAFDEFEIFAGFAVEGFVAQDEFAGFGGGEWAEVDAMEVGFGVRDRVAAGDEKFGALAGLQQQREDLGGDLVFKSGSGGGEDVFEVIENE